MLIIPTFTVVALAAAVFFGPKFLSKWEARKVAEVFLEQLTQGNFENAFESVFYFDKASDIEPTIPYEKAQNAWVDSVKSLKEKGIYVTSYDDLRIFLRDGGHWVSGDVKLTVMENGKENRYDVGINFLKRDGKWKISNLQRQSNNDNQQTDWEYALDGNVNKSSENETFSCGLPELFNTVRIKNGGEDTRYTWDGETYCEAAEKINAFTATFEVLESVEEGEHLSGVISEKSLDLIMINRVITIPLGVVNPEKEVFVYTKGIGNSIVKGDKQKLDELLEWLKANGVTIPTVEEPAVFALDINGRLISLREMDYEVDLEKVLGNPVSQNVEELGDGADTLTGSFIKILKYDGLRIELFSPKQDGKDFWIMTMDIFKKGYKTSRGIEVGNTVEEVKNAYPSIEIALDGRTDPNNCAYVIRNEEQYNYLQFEVQDGMVSGIKIFHLIP